MSTYKLYYINARGGAEVSRFVFALADVKTRTSDLKATSGRMNTRLVSILYHFVVWCDCNEGCNGVVFC